MQLPQLGLTIITINILTNRVLCIYNKNWGVAYPTTRIPNSCTSQKIRTHPCENNRKTGGETASWRRRHFSWWLWTTTDMNIFIEWIIRFFWMNKLFEWIFLPYNWMNQKSPLFIRKINKKCLFRTERAPFACFSQFFTVFTSCDFCFQFEWIIYWIE